jgi:nucleoside diphosphate kinase
VSRERSYLLLKPDAIDQSLEDVARAGVKERGLEIVDERPVRIERADLDVLWPMTFELHSLSMDLLEHYVCRRPSHLLVVEGDDAVSRAKSVKADLRRRFARGLIANVVHAPDDAEEADRELRLLTTWPRADRGPFRAPDRHRHLGADFGVFGYPPAELRDATQRFLSDWDAGRGIDPEVVPDPGGRPHVVLQDDRINTLDSAVAGLLTVFPDLGLYRAIRIVMTVDARNAAVVVPCDPGDWPETRRRLAEAGLPNTDLVPVLVPVGVIDGR